MSLALVRAVARAAVEHGEVDCPVRHEFSDGLYLRTMYIPKGTIIVGKVHLKETLNICKMGDISILTTKGAVRFRVGDIAISAPGIQKIGYAHEDTIWVNVHATRKTDVAAIEEEFVRDPEVDADVAGFMRMLEVK